MARLFTVLAALNLLALLASFVLGMLSKFLDHGQFFIPHFTLGLFTAIGTLLVHCIIFTYFLGTGRWVKEVSIAYNLPDEPFYKPTRELKRASFPPALTAMLITITASAAGAGAQLQMWPWWIHFSLAIITLAVNVWAYQVEFRCVRVNAQVMEAVLIEVDRIRAEQGLVSNAEALRQEQS
jgi:phosphoglycerol transferase MdoB-like AlkP superfamily enzyme